MISGLKLEYQHLRDDYQRATQHPALLRYQAAEARHGYLKAGRIFLFRRLLDLVVLVWGLISFAQLPQYQHEWAAGFRSSPVMDLTRPEYLPMFQAAYVGVFTVYLYILFAHRLEADWGFVSWEIIKASVCTTIAAMAATASAYYVVTNEPMTVAFYALIFGISLWELVRTFSAAAWGVFGVLYMRLLAAIRKAFDGVPTLSDTPPQPLFKELIAQYGPLTGEEEIERQKIKQLETPILWGLLPFLLSFVFFLIVASNSSSSVAVIPTFTIAVPLLAGSLYVDRRATLLKRRILARVQAQPANAG